MLGECVWKRPGGRGELTRIHPPNLPSLAIGSGRGCKNLIGSSMAEWIKNKSRNCLLATQMVLPKNVCMPLSGFVVFQGALALCRTGPVMR